MREDQYALSDDVTPPSDDSPEQRIMALVDHVFTGRGRPRQEYRLSAEMVALSVNRPKIRKLITEFNEQLNANLVAWFEQIHGLLEYQPKTRPCALAPCWLG